MKRSVAAVLLGIGAASTFLRAPTSSAQRVPPVRVQGVAPQGANELAAVLVAVREARMLFLGDSARIYPCRASATWLSDTLVLDSQVLAYLGAATGGSVLESCPVGAEHVARDRVLSQVRLTRSTADVVISRRIMSMIVLESFILQSSGRGWQLKRIVITPVGTT
jgi:hypothetical protein